MSLIGDLRIRTRIIAVAAIPTVALLGMTIHDSATTWKAASEAQAVAELSFMASVIGATVHEIQRERGASTGFIGAKGQGEFGSLLDKQRAQTDAAVARYRGLDLDSEGITGDAAFRELAKAARTRIDALADLRRNVSSLDTPAPEVAKRFAETIARLIELVDTMSDLTTNSQITNRIHAFSALLQGKERAGQERAAGTAAFSSGTFAPESYQQFVRLGAMQTVYFATFGAYAGAAERKALEDALSGDAGRLVEAQRGVALKAPFGGTLSSVRGEEWYKATTSRIDALKGVEDRVAADLNEFAAATAAAERRSLLLSILSSAGLLALVIALATLVTRSITRPVTQIVGTMRDLAAGKLDVALDAAPDRSEIGDMVRSVAVFKSNAEEQRRLEAEIDANRSLSERERLEREKRQAEEAAEVQFAVDGVAMGLSALADGRLTYRIDTAFAPRLERIRVDFNGAIERLEDALVRVTGNAEAIAAGSSQIHAAADDLSRRTEQQAASVEETAAALAQITITVADTHRKAEEADRLVRTTRESAERSGTVVTQAVDAMKAIEASSSEIFKIIDVIDEIAFQTNLLALNAGVEAARAGETGRGFAVVAQEVRELAQRSASAAEDIKVLVARSSGHVRSGVDLVADTGRALTDMVEQVKRISANVLAIADASGEQATGIKEINLAVSQMDQGTQQNAAMVEETTAASHSLAKEAETLFALVGTFQTSKDAARSTPDTRPARPKASPARQLVDRVRQSFSGNNALKTEGWRDV